MAKKILILGDGGWGTAIAILLNKYGHNITIWGKFPEYTQEMKSKRENIKFLPGIKLPNAIHLINGINKFDKVDLIVIAIPTQFMRETLGELKDAIDTKTPFLSVAKGIEIKELKRPSEIICDIFGGKIKIGVLSGPSHAEEVTRGLPTNVVLASRDKNYAKWLQNIFNGPTFRVYTSTDYIGIELGGALKNIIAIAAGICDGLKLGDNAKSALLSRGIVEISRLGEALGAKKIPSSAYLE